MTSASDAPFVLTPRLVAEKALPLLIEGKLGMQLHPDKEKHRANPLSPGCFYRHPVDGAPCVVGAALPDEVAIACDQEPSGTSLRSLAAIGLLDVGYEDRLVLDQWQRYHDRGDFLDLRAALEAELAKGA